MIFTVKYLFFTILLLCVLHYCTTYWLFTSFFTKHTIFKYKSRYKAVQNCLMKRNVMICRDLVAKNKQNKELDIHGIVVLRTGNDVCPSEGIISSGVHLPMTSFMEIECWCDLCHE